MLLKAFISGYVCFIKVNEKNRYFYPTSNLKILIACGNVISFRNIWIEHIFALDLVNKLMPRRVYRDRSQKMF